MALTATQIRLLNTLTDFEPALKKGQLAAADQIRLGDLLNRINIATIASPAATAAVLAVADATYGQPEADLINELRTNFNAAVTLLNELRTAINNAAG